MDVQVNYLAVLLAGFVSMILGFVWYSPFVLGNPWMKEKGLTAEKLKSMQKEMGKLYGLSFIVGLLTAYVLSHVMVLSSAFYHYSSVQTGLTTGFWVWLGFMMPVQITGTIFGNKNWKLFGIDTGYQLVSILGMGLVLGLL